MSGFEPIKISRAPGVSEEFSDLEDATSATVEEDGFAPITGASAFSLSSGAFSDFGDGMDGDTANAVSEEGADGMDSALKSVREEYFEAGRKEGFEQGRQEIEEALRVAQKLRDRLDSTREQVFARSVKDIADAVMLIARQVVRRELSSAPSSIEQLVVSVLEQVRRSDEFVIRLSAAEHKKLSDLTPIVMDRLGRDASFRVEADPNLEPGGIVVETDYGRIDASVEAQIEAFNNVVDSWAREEVEVNDD